MVVMLSLTGFQTANGQKATADLIRLHTMAAQGDATAQYELAEKYRSGFPIQRNYNKALDLYKRSAEQGFASSQFRLGEFYEEGEIIEGDLSKAVELYRKAAEQGHSGGQYALAYLYHAGTGVERDIAAAIVWYRKAALQGDEWSQLTLGDQYRMGIAVPKDLVQSIRWYRMAARQGNTFAQYELGNAYRYGNGAEPNIEQSIEWYRRSAKAGNPLAKLSLAELEGDGTEYSGGDPKFSENPMPTVGDEDAAASSPKSEDVAQSAISALEGEVTVPVTGLAVAAARSHNDETVVSRLLAKAEHQVAILRLTAPESDNAYETYQLIRSLQPNNQAAIEGIEQIGVKYVELCELAVKKGKLEKAKHYAAKAAILAPENHLVLSMALSIEVDRSTTEANGRALACRS
jgi:TPR repeat protein